MRKNILNVALGIVVGFAISPLAYTVYSTFLPTPGGVVELNSSTLNSAAMVMELLSSNSDIMQRFAHYQEGHEGYPETMLCPECSGNRHIVDHQAQTEPYNEPTTRLAQVYDDAEEVNMTMRSILLSLLIQQDSLRMSLDRYRNE
mgnify:FL=1|tara:strand:- start:1390 stop:1824 length:435 start_codon:yes stop_codon:yes gene_type:complete